jgi:hypothetical protein
MNHHISASAIIAIILEEAFFNCELERMEVNSKKRTETAIEVEAVGHKVFLKIKLSQRQMVADR